MRIAIFNIINFEAKIHPSYNRLIKSFLQNLNTENNRAGMENESGNESGNEKENGEWEWE